MKGKIRNLRRESGYGFIEGDDGVDRFFHVSGLEQTAPHFQELTEGQDVEFTPIAAPRGPRAIEVPVFGDVSTARNG